MDPISFEKLKEIEARLVEVEAGMSDPVVAQDPAAFQKLARESKEISPIVERYRAYKKVLQELTKVEEMAEVMRREIAHAGLSVIIAARPCIPYLKRKKKDHENAE